MATGWVGFSYVSGCLTSSPGFRITGIRKIRTWWDQWCFHLGSGRIQLPTWHLGLPIQLDCSLHCLLFSPLSVQFLSSPQLDPSSTRLIFLFSSANPRELVKVLSLQPTSETLAHGLEAAWYPTMSPGRVSSCHLHSGGLRRTGLGGTVIAGSEESDQTFAKMMS